jgi:poly(A) polymerase
LVQKFGLYSISEGINTKTKTVLVTKSKIEREYPLTENLSPFYFHPKKGEWRKFQGTDKKIELNSMKVLTFNILFDIFDKDLIHTKYRIPELMKVMKESKADIIGLQEVTKEFLSELIKEDWLKKKYLISDIDGSTLDPYGVILLSSIPLETLTYFKYLEKSKPILFSTFNLNGKPFGLAILHLPSDKTAQCEKKREFQLKQAVGKLKDIENSIIMGDFNFGDEDQSYAKIYENWNDLWKQKYPKSKGYTYDPDSNYTAKATTSKFLCKRLDRMLSNSKIFHIEEVTLIGTESFYIQEKNCMLHPSDHFGLLSTIKFI